MTANHIGVRELNQDGLVYMTNHFLHPDMEALHQTTPASSSTRARFLRLEQLLEPGGAESLYGQLDVQAAVSILRDRKNTYTGETVDVSVFDYQGEGSTIANNGLSHSMVFLGEERMIYLALGEVPISLQPYVGFHLDELFETNPDAVANPAIYQ